MRKLPAKYETKVMPLLLSILMTFIVSLVSTLRAVGLSDDFIALWSQSWLLSWLVAFPVLLIVLPIVRRLTRLLVAAP
ncbi:DUF2798 domain-containing protein [Pseudidiomarina taiwanensis]|uniref:DUF2798 domain-containing protein n=1 Tax=Pseudidiomarina taiwanensis TaxID=337250 RepID=A0A432ZEK3_9GAMM|nr:DUF2798 domain-containing protein [Pseudidiomarina taiwanensis]RUO76363.1 hypothetical protein CWI83_08345 [Pseudidiomarina taiwanensis]